MTTRREWLKQNPPPRSAAHTRQLLEELKGQDEVRKQYLANKQAYESQHIPYWQQEERNARAQGNTTGVNYAAGQLAIVRKSIAEIDQALLPLSNVPTRIAALEKEVAGAAKCSKHNHDLVRHNNRPEDLFVCQAGPHFFLWVRNGSGGKLEDVDITKPMPELDKPILDGLALPPEEKTAEAKA